MSAAIKTGRVVLAARGGSRHSEHLRDLTAWREDVISAAVEAKKIPEDRADDYRKMFAASPVEIHRLLTARPADGGLVAGTAVETDYPADWLPEIHASGTPAGRVMGDVPAVVEKEPTRSRQQEPAEDGAAYPAEWIASDLAKPTGDVPRVVTEEI